MILQIQSTLGISIALFLLTIIITVVAILFYMNWGDKIQLIKKRALFFILSIIPGVIINIYYIILLHDKFGDNFLNVMIVALLISAIPVVIIKHISFRTIQYQQIRELTKLEKGKILLQIKNLKVYYPLLGGFLKRQIGAVKAVDGVDLSVKTGETLGLVGESGCGKTTLAKAVLGLVEVEEGEMLFHDIPIDEKFTSYLRQKIQIVFQDPDASLNPRLKVIDIIGEPLKNLLGITKKAELRRHVLRLLEEVSLKREHLDRYPDEFSGGQKQRIVIARALACNPELIILDEPTSALDVSVQAQIINLLQNLQSTYGYGFLFITHNLSVVNHIADQVAVMYLGRIVEIGTKNQVFSKPTHPYTQALLKSRIRIDPDSQDIKYVIDGEVPSPIAPPPGCHFNPRCSSDSRTKECEFEIPHKMKIEDNHYIWCVNPPIGIDVLEEVDSFDSTDK
ncbi:MAG: ABC transporter ATP-binding protein [Promethearchaeota archaeon]|jgi:oligopeptide/dipeptide ABC transporter ATP-binding protein